MTDMKLDLAAILKDTTQRQGRAANPATSAFVSANAGTGKTHILVNRVLRLLLEGAEPFRILCLTYTKAAAAEMENRLFSTLSKWVTMPEGELKEALEELIGQLPTQEQLTSARRLFARAIETPGGMKVQTIHGFCEKLLQRFPLEADVPPHFKVIDDVLAEELLTRARETILKEAISAPTSEAAKALNTVIAYSTDIQFEELINNAINARSIWGRVISDRDRRFIDELSEFIPLPEERDAALWRKRMATSVDENLAISMIAELQSEGGSTNEGNAAALQTWLTAKTESAQIEALKSLFTTKQNELRAKLCTNAVQNNAPALADQLYNAQDQFYQSYTNYEMISLAEATASLLHLADQITCHYQALKRQRAALDFQDLINHTAILLTSRVDTAWVLYKLDRGLEHILVDEAQDTSPEQWQVIASLTEEFFSGDGASEARRTLFAVGDEKQSIYGFQGAEPRQFGEMARRFEAAAKASDKPFERIPLNLSFRSTSAVLGAVDRIFAAPAMREALTMSSGEITHFANRAAEPGLVEIWPLLHPEESEANDAFEPLSESSGKAVDQQLAEKIARKIRRWLDEGEWLHSKQRPVRAGDILILLRKRNPLAPLIIRALKSEGIPVAGADRITVKDQIAVMDMLALGDFLMLPENDLALAALLKSPVFNLDDSDLFTLSYSRKGSLWQSLRYFAEREAKYKPIAAQLSLWLSRADILPPFEFFANLLEGEGLRQKFIARMGAVAGDALDEFLNLTLQYDEQEAPSLQGFLDWMRRNKADVKRDMEKGRDEVRIMTVHGAKGLEAEITFLPDTCSTASLSKSESLLTTRSGNEPESIFANRILWAPKGKHQLDPVTSMRDHRKQAEKQEQLRLLYVALTRARDRLYIAGFTGVKGMDNGCWYQLITEGLAQSLQPGTDENGDPILQMKSGTLSAPQPDVSESSEATPPQPALPEWYSEKAASEPVRSIPAAPSSLLPYETPADDEEKLLTEPSIMSPRKLGNEARFLRGRLVHKLLEHLPGLEGTARQAAAESLAAHHGRDLKEAARSTIISEIYKILDHSAYQPLFGKGSRAEVSLIARLKPQKTGKAPLLLQGQIDRLLITDEEIMIIDYKSNRPGPRAVADVAPAYLAQMAAYRAALKKLYPGKKVTALLLWTDGPYLMPLPDETLDSYDHLLDGGNG